MANEEHLKILLKGVEVWNQWRRENAMRPDLIEANLYGANLREADLTGAELRKANLYEANLYEANLGGTDLYKANLGEADLTIANLSRVGLSGATLIRANLREADLSEANLSEANLSEANLSEADLARANLREADLTRVNLIGADLFRVNLIGANLTRAKLDRTNFRETQVGWTTFGDTDLSVVEGLDTVAAHHGPSTIGIDTLYLSNGNIPEVFLRGCGLRDWEIEATKLYQPDLTPTELTDITYKIHELRITAIHYYSCFISYSSKDQDFAQCFHTDLQQKGVRCWFAPEDMKIGDKIRPRIDESIRIHDKLLVILSENSMQSDWVEDEVETAIEEEKKRQTTVLFPIRLDEAVIETNQAWAAKLRRTRHIGDFSRWKDQDAYQQAFEHLLRDLKAEG
jgi:uncharacterized protein YjbI with pentapeptide repeats